MTYNHGLAERRKGVTEDGGPGGATHEPRLHAKASIPYSGKPHGLGSPQNSGEKGIYYFYFNHFIAFYNSYIIKISLCT